MTRPGFDDYWNLCSGGKTQFDLLQPNGSEGKEGLAMPIRAFAPTDL